MVIRRVGPLSCARIAAVIYVIIGLFAGAIVSLVAVAGGFGHSTEGTAIGALLGVGAVILLPIMYGCFGFLGALLVTWLYNVLAELVGGVEIDVQ